MIQRSSLASTKLVEGLRRRLLGSEPEPDTGGRVPSYMYKLNESRRRKVLLNQFGHRQRVWAHNSKREGAAFAVRHGAAVPEVSVESVPIDELVWGELPARFALKPVHGAANRGVFLLERIGPDAFVDLMDYRTKSTAEVVAHYATHLEQGRVSANVSVEELLRPRPSLQHRITAPDDFKIYTFYDRAAVVMQRRSCGSTDRADWRFKFWSADWDDLGAVKYPDRCDETLECPEGAHELIATAELLGRRLAVPFVRLDLFDTDRGVVFGELSPHPGPPEVWSPELDEELGHAWETAEARLMVEGVWPNEPFRPGNSIRSDGPDVR